MNWKNTLRKAPFRVSDEQAKAREENLKKKKNLLEELQSLLEKHIDEPFRKVIRQYPQSMSYTVKSSNFFDKLNNLIASGLSNLDVEKHLAEEYDVEDIMLDYQNKTITFDK